MVEHVTFVSHSTDYQFNRTVAVPIRSAMASIVLVYGWPNSGTSALAATLKANGFHLIAVDHIYIDFIEAEFPDSAGAYLSRNIRAHYEGGLGQQSSHGMGFRHNEAQRHCWHGHLLHQIEAAVANHSQVVVEGYLLRDCRTLLHLHLTSQRHSVVHVRAEQQSDTEVDPGLRLPAYFPSAL